MLRFTEVLLALLLAVPGWAVRQEFATPASIDTVVVRVDSATEQVVFMVGTTPSVATPTTRTVFSTSWSAGTVFNENSRATVDFRVESDAGDSALVIDAGGDSLFSEVRAHFRGAMYGRSTFNAIGNVGIGIGTTDALGLRILKASANVGVSLERTTDVTATSSAYVDANGDLSVGPETNHGIVFRTSNSDRAKIDLNGNMVILNTASAPGVTVTNAVHLYADDVAASSELRVRDEAGNFTTLSPHNFSLLGSPSEPMAWSFYSKRDGVAINVDMLRVVRLVEQLTGEQLVIIKKEGEN